MKTSRQTVKMDADQHMGDLYPFSLSEKLKVISEPSPLLFRWRQSLGPADRPVRNAERAVSIPAREDRLPVRGPAVGLFADQEIRLLRGPLFVGENYITEREVVALSGSPPHRKHVGAHHGVCRRHRAGRDDCCSISPASSNPMRRTRRNTRNYMREPADDGSPGTLCPAVSRGCASRAVALRAMAGQPSLTSLR